MLSFVCSGVTGVNCKAALAVSHATAEHAKPLQLSAEAGQLVRCTFSMQFPSPESMLL